jgi:carbon starvation protein
MSLLTVVVASAACLFAAYWVYGPVLTKLLRLDPKAQTPAVALRDDVDYAPIEPRFLLTQHFSAIAAAGPIVGPILAGAMFGWLPALLWILIGSILIGGVHDMTALVASIRHQARSIAEVVRDHMTRRSYVLFLTFVWLALIYIVVAFTDITAASFVGRLELESGQVVSGGGIATSSLLYLALPVMMGLLLRYTKMSLGLATAIFLPLVAVSIWVGQYVPLDIAGMFGLNNATAQRCWGVALLIYCFIASIVPMWLLLQPRGHLGGFFLFAALGGGALGLMLGGETIQYPAFTGWQTAKAEPVFPLLFVTIACGACSGFHSLIASGTTSKQLRRETDARLIGYGTMLMEGMVAVVSLCCIMMLPANSPTLAGGPKPNLLYALGVGRFLEVLGIPPGFAVAFGLMAFTTFVYDTLDVCTRLGRYIIQELTGWQDAWGRLFATGMTAGLPLFFLLRQPLDPDGRLVPTWKVFWDLFGASNQLLAALALIGVTVWLWRTRRALWVWLVTGIPMIWMYVMSTWALARIIASNVGKDNLLVLVGGVLLALAALMLLEAIYVILSVARPRTRPPIPVVVPAS